MISRSAAIECLMTNMVWYDDDGCSDDDGNEKRAIITDLVNKIPAVDAIPVEWLEYMQRESLSENDRTMVGAIEAIFIEWHIYVNRLREMNRQKEQEGR